MRFFTVEGVVMRLQCGVVVRTRSAQSQESEVSKLMLELAGARWCSTGVVCVLVSTQEMKMENITLQLEMYITGDMIEQYEAAPGYPMCRSVAREDSGQHTLSHTGTHRYRIEWRWRMTHWRMIA